MMDSGAEQPRPSWQPAIYEQLHRLARTALDRESPGHSLQPTLIVNDAYLRLLEQKNVDLSNRSQVLAVGATIIRRLLVDYARKRNAEKRGGTKGQKIPLRVSIPDRANHIAVLDLADALTCLGQESPRAAQVVEMRFFGGATADEIADHLGVSPRTISNDWRYAKAWLYEHLGSDTRPSLTDDDES